MPPTYQLIANTTLTTTTATVTFSNIAGTYTDLVVKCSTRSNAADVSNTVNITLSSDTGSNYSRTQIIGDGSTATSGRSSNQSILPFLASAAASLTADSFGTFEIYIPSYTASQNKPISGFAVTEANSASDARIYGAAYLWRNTSAVSSIKFELSGGNSFVSGSSFFLYGIKNS
jgi:hypothetical protein